MQITTAKTGYTRWLLNKLGVVRTDYIFLCNLLNSLEFYWSIDDDSNRNADGLALRTTYADEVDPYIYDEMPGVASVLEILCSLSERADWIIRSSPETWFTTFLTNLGLDFLSDSFFTADSEAFVVAVIHKWLDRRFSPSGVGSPFRSSKYDMTRVSMWDSLQWYLADEFSEDAI